MHINGAEAIGIALVIIFLVQFLLPAAKESGHLSRRKSSAFRQFPTFPDGEE